MIGEYDMVCVLLPLVKPSVHSGCHVVDSMTVITDYELKRIYCP